MDGEPRTATHVETTTIVVDTTVVSLPSRTISHDTTMVKHTSSLTFPVFSYDPPRKSTSSITTHTTTSSLMTTSMVPPMPISTSKSDASVLGPPFSLSDPFKYNNNGPWWEQSGFVALKWGFALYSALSLFIMLLFMLGGKLDYKLNVSCAPALLIS